MKLKQFFSPVYNFFATTTFKPWMGGADSKPPVNAVLSHGGITVTPDVAMTLSAVWACVFRYSTTISTLPLKLMRGPQPSAKPAEDHPIYNLIHVQANPWMSSTVFWQTMVTSMLLWGQAYALKNRIGKRVVALTPMRPEYVTLYWQNNRLRCAYDPPVEAERRDVPMDDIFSVFDRTIDGYSGVSRIEFARNALGLAVAADRAANAFYRNGLRAAGILTVSQWLKDSQREQYREQLRKFYGTGSGTSDDQQYSVFVAENATKFEPISLKPADVELLAARRFSIEDVCRWFDTPPILVGHAAEGQTMWGTGIEQLVLGWVKLGLTPILVTIEKEIQRQLLLPEERMEYFAKFNLDALLRGDSAGRTSMYSSMVQNGIYTRNEIRAKEDLPPVDGGDVLTVQSNLIPLDKLEEAMKVRAAAPALGEGEESTQDSTDDSEDEDAATEEDKE